MNGSLPSADPPAPEEASEGTAAWKTRRRPLAVLGGVLFVAVLFILVARAIGRAPPEIFQRLGHARPVPVLAGLGVYALAFLARGVRLNLLLPREERIPLARAWSVSGAATFLLQVVPFRGGEVAGWAVLKHALGASWARSGALFALVKLVDSGTLLLVGSGGAALLAVRRGAPLLGGSAAALVLAVSVFLLLLPRLGASRLPRLAARLPDGSRRKHAAEEIAQGLAATRERPSLYAAALLGSLVFFAGHLAALRLILAGLGASASTAALAFATLTSVFSAGAIPSPAGTFGPMESGFAAGLFADGIPLAEGILAGAALHVLTTLVSGLVGLPLLLRSARGHR